MKSILKWPAIGLTAMLLTMFMGGCQDDNLVAQRNQLFQQNQQLKQQLDQSNADLASARAELAQQQAAEANQSAAPTQEQAGGTGENSVLPSFGNTPGGQEGSQQGSQGAENPSTGGGAELKRFVLYSDISFASGSAHLEPSASHTLLDVVHQLNAEYSGRNVVIEGYTDNRPIHHTYPSNYALGLARAKAVERFLEDHGISSDRLKAVSFGDTHLVSTTDLARDRRVEIVVMR
jgi:flagellar motor protein MotB